MVDLLQETIGWFSLRGYLISTSILAIALLCSVLGAYDNYESKRGRRLENKHWLDSVSLDELRHQLRFRFIVFLLSPLWPVGLAALAVAAPLIIVFAILYIFYRVTLISIGKD